MIISSYSINNLINVAESLLDATKSLNLEITSLQQLKDEVTAQQQQTQRQGQLVKKTVNLLSQELARLEKPDPTLGVPSLAKLAKIETRLRLLKGQLIEFADDSADLKKSDLLVAENLKHYETFLLDLASTINQKILQLEKMAARIKAECKETQQQKLLLKEIAALFFDELGGLEDMLVELRGDSIIK
jgi:chromosome segregation ATPase